MTTAYDVSTCSFDSVRYVDTDVLQNGTTAGDRAKANRNKIIKPSRKQISRSKKST